MLIAEQYPLFLVTLQPIVVPLYHDILIEELVNLSISSDQYVW